MSSTPLTFTPPASGSTRLSPDVWALICDHAESNGNSSPREALEQIVRQAIGNAQSVMLNCLETASATSSAAPSAAPVNSNNAAAALDSLLLD